MYFCLKCGGQCESWRSICPACGARNSIAFREPRAETAPDAPQLQTLEAASAPTVARIDSGFDGLDSILGGGFARGAAYLVAGAPGAGKSTLALQAIAHVSRAFPVLYVCGEETPGRLRERAIRLNLDLARINVSVATELTGLARVIRAHRPRFVVVDSLNTLHAERLRSRAGAPSQMIHCCATLKRLSETLNLTALIVGHVTKSNVLAGPRTVEHAVDAMLYFETERGPIRKAFLSKNRFGPAFETVFFTMTPTGLIDGRDKSA